MDILYIVIPAYNEQENIRSVIEDWYPVVEKYNGDGLSRLVIIDDGSKDHTYEIVKEMSAERPMLEGVTKGNSGHGGTVLYGYNYAVEHGADYVFQTDSDGQTLSGEFDSFWDLRKQYDMVIGNRISREDGVSRVFVTKVLKLVIRLCFGVSLTDANTPFRLMKASLVEKYINKLPEDFNIPNIMFTTYFVYHHEKVKFIPITFKPRQGGVNSINIKKIVKIGWKAVGDFHKLRREINDV